MRLAVTPSRVPTCCACRTVGYLGDWLPLLVYGKENFLGQPFGTVELVMLFSQEKEDHTCADRREWHVFKVA